MGFTNVEIMIPFVRTLKEAESVVRALKDNGLERGKNGLRLIMMCELPTNAVLAEQYLQYFDGFSTAGPKLREPRARRRTGLPSLRSTGRTSLYRRHVLPCTSALISAQIFPRSKPPLRMIPEWCSSKLKLTSARMQGAMSRESPARILRSWCGRRSKRQIP